MYWYKEVLLEALSEVYCVWVIITSISELLTPTMVDMQFWNKLSRKLSGLFCSAC